MGENVATRILPIACCVVLFTFPVSNCCGQTIVLRDLQLIDDVKVISMSVEGIALEDGRSRSWDLIQEGEVSTEQQVEFDRWRTEIGEPLFRVRLRLASGDYASLQPHANDLASRTVQNEPNSSVYYLACCAQVRSCLYQKQREAALVPLLEILRLRNPTPPYMEIEELASLHFSEDGICHELLPVWFHSDVAAEQLAQIRQSVNFLETSSGATAQVYLNTLAISAGESKLPFESTAIDDPWRLLYSAQSALLAGNHEQVVSQLDANLFSESAERHAIALYYLGMAQSRLPTPSIDSGPVVRNPAWMLTLLKIPALYEDRFTELSAAAISAVVNHSDSANQEDYETLRKELAGRYRQTTFGTPRK